MGAATPTTLSPPDCGHRRPDTDIHGRRGDAPDIHGRRGDARAGITRLKGRGAQLQPSADGRVLSQTVK